MSGKDKRGKKVKKPNPMLAKLTGRAGKSPVGNANSKPKDPKPTKGYGSKKLGGRPPKGKGPNG